MKEVWWKLSEMLKDREPASQSSREETEPEPPKTKLDLLMGSESDDEARHKAEPSVSTERALCQLCHLKMPTS